MVDAALSLLQRWKNSESPLPLLAATGEASHQQLLHAAALNAQDSGDFLRAKALYENYLATDPTTTDEGMLTSSAAGSSNFFEPGLARGLYRDDLGRDRQGENARSGARGA